MNGNDLGNWVSAEVGSLMAGSFFFGVVLGFVLAMLLTWWLS